MSRRAPTVVVCVWAAALIVALRADQDFEIEQVQVIFRHGDRAAGQIEVYKTDPYDDIYRRSGYGQLTEQGMRREYQLGLLLRRRYDELLGPVTRYDSYFARSTDYERTKMSLQLVLAGLNSRRRYDELYWTPVPVKYVERQLDFMRIVTQCPRFRKLFDELEATPDLRAKFRRYESFYAYLRNVTGLTTRRLFTPYVLYTNVHSALQMGLGLPDWCAAEHMEQLREIAAMLFDALVATEEMRRIAVGPTIDEILNNVYEQERGVNEARKMYLYSGHDINLATFLRAHEFDRVPDDCSYGSAVIIEKLRGNDDERVYLRMMYYDGMTEELRPLKMPDCGYECPLEDYRRLVEPLLPTAEVRYCYSLDIFCDLVRYPPPGEPKPSTEWLVMREDIFSLKYPLS
ncbi:venom acid phosphatase Acph-1-like [Trichogramma pretiosum]|uniref:venom acid phosphatase Acph-1-like n=1 Tax=Trichogramma pretiosum TaxID=7493 RepID=UPI0006C9AF54|nr:venom acid phosphatase Acph-1-like [Trichogramma pretiosum]